MNDLIPFWAWSWLLTAVGITGLFLAGSMRKVGWALGFGAQGLWIAYALATEQYGFVASALAYGWVYARNWLRWRREQGKAFQVTSFTSYPYLADDWHGARAEAEGTGKVEVGHEFDYEGVRLVVTSVQHPEGRWHAMDKGTLAQRYRVKD